MSHIERDPNTEDEYRLVFIGFVGAALTLLIYSILRF